jgi:hypothetical protein
MYLYSIHAVSRTTFHLKTACDRVKLLIETFSEAAKQNDEYLVWKTELVKTDYELLIVLPVIYFIGREIPVLLSPNL